MKRVVGQVVKAQPRLEVGGACSGGPNPHHGRKIRQHGTQHEGWLAPAVSQLMAPRDHRVAEEIHSFEILPPLLLGVEPGSYPRRRHKWSEIIYERPMTGRFTIELLSRRVLAERVHCLRFVAHQGFRWAAGQYLVVVHGGGRQLSLPYSIACAVDEQRPAELELAVAIGAGADVMDELRPGASLEIEAPFGELTWQTPANTSALLISTGTGIAPLRALLQEELARRSSTRLILLAGHRAAEDVLFHDELAQLAQDEPRFRFVPTLTRAAKTWSGERGRVQSQLAAAVASLSPLDAYVCGRLDMVTEVADALETLGVPRSRMHTEGY